jgi:hypothetical protein
MHGLQLTEVLPNHPIPPRRKGNRADTGKHGEQCGRVVPQVKPLLPPPLHRPGHGDVEVRVNSIPGLGMNNHTPEDCQLRI